MKSVLENLTVLVSRAKVDSVATLGSARAGDGDVKKALAEAEVALKEAEQQVRAAAPAAVGSPGG